MVRIFEKAALSVHDAPSPAPSLTWKRIRGGIGQGYSPQNICQTRLDDWLLEKTQPFIFTLFSIRCCQKRAKPSYILLSLSLELKGEG